ncbi:MAG: hypothetical protein ABI333_23480, partial [bacterium]
MESNAPEPFETKAQTLVAARCSLVVVQTSEERRLQRHLRSVAQSLFSLPVPLFVWTLTEGMREGDQPLVGTEDPVVALDEAIAYSQHALFLFHDLHCLFDDPRVVRRLRDAHRVLAPTYKTIFLSGPLVELPRELRKDFATLELPMPNLAEIEGIFEDVRRSTDYASQELGD